MYNNNTERKQSINTLLKTNPTIWETTLSNKLGRLAQGIQNVEANNRIGFIAFNNVSKDCIVKFSNMVCDIYPHCSRAQSAGTMELIK